MMSGECDKCGEHALECGCLNPTAASLNFRRSPSNGTFSVLVGLEDYKPQQPISLLGCEGYETYTINENTIGIRPKWISVEDRLPTDDQWIYLGSSKFQTVSWGIYMNGKFVNPDLNYMEITNITHWMPLPEPPEKL